MCLRPSKLCWLPGIYAAPNPTFHPKKKHEIGNKLDNWLKKISKANSECISGHLKLVGLWGQPRMPQLRPVGLLSRVTLNLFISSDPPFSKFFGFAVSTGTIYCVNNQLRDTDTMRWKGFQFNSETILIQTSGWHAGVDESVKSS